MPIRSTSPHLPAATRSNSDAVSLEKAEVKPAEAEASKATSEAKPTVAKEEPSSSVADPKTQAAARQQSVVEGNQLREAWSNPPAGAVKQAKRGLAATELGKGARGPRVKNMQQDLKDLGFAVGAIDGKFGPGTERVLKQFQAGQGLPQTGVVDAATQEALQTGLPQVKVAPGTPGVSERTPYGRYKPHSDAAKALFTEATKEAGVPESWGNNPALHDVLAKETQGRVGIPNYTFGADQTRGERWAQVRGELISGLVRTKSTATGLGQMTLPNVDKYYPDGREGIGDPKNEAIGMLKYIKDRYGSPEAALEFHNKKHWY